MAATPATRANGDPLFDYLVDVEGVNNLIETYLEARRFDTHAQGEIERETGGPIESNPQPYLDRTNVLHTRDMKAAGLKGAVLVQGVDDGLVPYNQSPEMFAALTAALIPTESFTAITKTQPDTDTTLSGTIVKAVGGPTYSSPLAGHASERSTTHIVMTTAFNRLADIFNHQSPCTGAFVVDGQTNVQVGAAC
jgi:hypothetical protein